MSDKDSLTSHQDDERVLDLETAKEMTVAEAAKTQGEMEAGITKDDGLLDRYIKQHRDQIEADKYETKKIREQELAKVREQVAQDDQTQVLPNRPVMTDSPSSDWESFDETSADFEERQSEKRQKLISILLAALAFLVIVFSLYSQRSRFETFFGKGQTSSSLSSGGVNQKSKTKSSVKPAEKSAALKAFEDSYSSFFTDANQKALKNEQFSQLPELEKALAAITDSHESSLAKAKFESLRTAIDATKALNEQFNKPVLVDGDIDTTATVKPGVSLTAASTGISTVSSALTAAVNFGRSQQEAATSTALAAPQGSTSVASVPSKAPVSAESNPSTSAALANGLVLDYSKRVVYGDEQIALRRDLSRVPYNDAIIADAANEAWVFNPGVLEQIIATSNQRGYFKGNEFILEKVNIINGRGYYNLFRTDGLYLFSINAKTGYFVGNGSGHAEALDY